MNEETQNQTQSEDNTDLTKQEQFVAPNGDLSLEASQAASKEATDTLQPQLSPSGDKLYPLDWKDTEVKLSKGRFVHTLTRPSAVLMLQRDDDIDREIPIAKDGSYGLPDETVQEELDAKYYDQVKTGATGYGDREIPTLHKAKAFQSLFLSEVEADEDADIFDEEITVHEEIGGGEDPDFIVDHIMRQPEQKELGKIRRIFKNGRLKPDKRGRQKFVETSNLRKAMMYYSTYLVKIVGASVGGQKFSAESRDEFIANVNPLVQRAVVKAMVEKLTGSLLD